MDINDKTWNPWHGKAGHMNVAEIALDVHFGAGTDMKHLNMVKGMRYIF